jgi:hypothetical protein
MREFLSVPKTNRPLYTTFHQHGGSRVNCERQQQKYGVYLHTMSIERVLLDSFFKATMNATRYIQ